MNPGKIQCVVFSRLSVEGITNVHTLWTHIFQFVQHTVVVVVVVDDVCLCV